MQTEIINDMIVCLSVLRKPILNPEYYMFMFDCMFVGGHFSSKLSVAKRASKHGL